MIFVDLQTLIAAQFVDAIQSVVESTFRASYNQQVIFFRGINFRGCFRTCWYLSFVPKTVPSE